MDDEDLDGVLALSVSCCEQAGFEPLPLDEAPEKAQRYHASPAPASDAQFRMY